MNPITATLRATDLCILLDVAPRSFERWLPRPIPVHVDFSAAPRGRMYALPEVLTFLRANRKRGLYGDDLARIVKYDTSERAERAASPGFPDDVWLGGTPEVRSESFRAALIGAEVERARLVQKAVGQAAVVAGVPRVERLRQIVLIHPAVVRFILANEGDELPAGDAGWKSWVRAVDIVNIPATEHKEAA